MIRLRVTLKVVKLGEIDNQIGSVLFDFDRGVRDFGRGESAATGVTGIP